MSLIASVPGRFAVLTADSPDFSRESLTTTATTKTLDPRTRRVDLFPIAGGGQAYWRRDDGTTITVDNGQPLASGAETTFYVDRQTATTGRTIQLIADAATVVAVLEWFA